MKVAIPLWQGRVSPVFDEASSILVFDVTNGREKCRHKEVLLVRNAFKRAQLLVKLDVEVLICGMISQMQHAALDSAGIQIIPHICGPSDEVIAAFLDGRIESGAMLMPGCGRRKRLHNHGKRA
jgi:predicted Fe-Mo cluster-binding NifX family protein